VFDRVAAAGQAFSAENWTNDYRYLNPALHRALDYYPVGALNRTLYAAGSSLLPFHARRTQRISAVNLAFIRAVLEIEGTDAFFDGMKGALRLQYLSQIDGLDVRVIRIVRDVRAFVRSKRKAGVKAADAAREWLYRQESAEAVLRRFTPENVLTIRYEQLAREYNREMGRIFEHLGLEPFTIPEEIDPREFHIFGNSMRLRGPIRIRFSEQWRDELPREDLDTALRIAGECNARLGYA
jgi:hypothetical protein